MELESYMNRVVDPGAGSYFIEKLTDDIAQSAWKIFQNKNQTLRKKYEKNLSCQPWGNSFASNEKMFESTN